MKAQLRSAASWLTLGALAVVLAPQVALAVPPPDSVPLDGGLTALGAACGAYGLKKLYDRRRNRNADGE